MKKTLAILLMLAMLCGCVSAMASERETLTILIAEDTLIIDFEENKMTKYIEENCNVNLDFVLLPATDPAQKLQLMINSGEKLPDVICYDMNVSTAFAYAQAGALIPIEDLYEKYSVKLKAAVEKYPELMLLEQVTAADGHMYGMPKYMGSLNNNTKYRYWINYKWLENLDMELPTTTEEFYEVLKAFKEKDPNGNGVADEIPLAGAWSNDTSTYNLIPMLMNSFIYCDPAKDYLYAEDGKIIAAYAQEGWKAGLEYMNKLCEEELLDPASFTQTSSQLLATLGNAEACILGTYAVQGMKDSYPDEFDILLPLEGPTGLRQINWFPTTAIGAWFITADCKNPELAFKVGDFLADDEGYCVSRYGEENVDWWWVEEGSTSLYGLPNAFFDTPEDTGDYVNPWTKATSQSWRQKGPIVSPVGADGNKQDDVSKMKPASVKTNAAIGELQKYKPADGTWLTMLNYTADEEFAINDIKATIDTYVVESMVRFITGDMDIATEWDAYLAELNNMGLETYITTAQAAYDRMIK